MKNANGLNQPRRHGPGNQPPAIRKPLDQHGNGNDVAEAQTNSADHSIAQIQPPQPTVGETSQEDSHSIKNAAGQRNDAWAATIQPQTAEECGYTQHEDADGKR